MNGSTKLGLTLLGLTLLAIGIIDVTRVQPIDWAQTYDQRDKIPYGLYVTHAELPGILGPETQMETFHENRYPEIRDLLADRKGTSLVYIESYFGASNAVRDELLSFAEGGGEVFVSANTFHSLIDTLGVKLSYHYPQTFGQAVDRSDRPFALNDGTAAYYNELEYPGLFYGLDSSRMKIIGSYEVGDGKWVPNFIEVRHGKGRFLLHLEPLMFTNYYMLREENYRYAAAALKLLQNKKLLWYDGHYRFQAPRTPLRVLLLNDGLRQAWYVLLFGLLLFLLFKSKRESRAVRVLRPEPNLSREFARTIASLYYESGSPGNLVHKKIEYFRYDLRTHYRLDILQMEQDADFADRLAMLSGTERTDCRRLVALLNECRKRRSFTDRELKDIDRTIEDFKRKANMP